MSETVATSTIPNLPIDDLALTLTYSGSFVATISCVYQGRTYVKTFTNNGTNITGVSVWVAQ